MKINEYEYVIPKNVRESLDRYIVQGIEPGGFLMAVLQNNLMEAVGRADHINIGYLKDICGHIYNNLPSTCHGSPEKVRAFLADFAFDPEDAAPEVTL